MAHFVGFCKEKSKRCDTSPSYNLGKTVTEPGLGFAQAPPPTAV